jgi:hypothetical protein
VADVRVCAHPDECNRARAIERALAAELDQAIASDLQKQKASSAAPPVAVTVSTTTARGIDDAGGAPSPESEATVSLPPSAEERAASLYARGRSLHGLVLHEDVVRAFVAICDAHKDERATLAVDLAKAAAAALKSAPPSPCRRVRIDRSLPSGQLAVDNDTGALFETTDQVTEFRWVCPKGATPPSVIPGRLTPEQARLRDLEYDCQAAHERLASPPSRAPVDAGPGYSATDGHWVPALPQTRGSR